MLSPAAAYAVLGVAGLIALHYFLKDDRQGKWVKIGWIGMILGMAVQDAGLYHTMLAVGISIIFAVISMIGLASLPATANALKITK